MPSIHPTGLLIDIIDTSTRKGAGFTIGVAAVEVDVRLDTGAVLSGTAPLTTDEISQVEAIMRAAAARQASELLAVR